MREMGCTDHVPEKSGEEIVNMASCSTAHACLTWVMFIPAASCCKARLLFAYFWESSVRVRSTWDWDWDWGWDPNIRVTHVYLQRCRFISPLWKGERSVTVNIGSTHPNCQHKVRWRDLVPATHEFQILGGGLEEGSQRLREENGPIK